MNRWAVRHLGRGPGVVPGEGNVRGKGARTGTAPGGAIDRSD